MKKKTTILLVLFIVSGLKCDRRTPDDFLKIENRWFSKTEFFANTPRHTFQYLPKTEQEKKIDRFLDRQLLVYFAIDENYQRLPDVRKEIKKIRRRLLINEFFDRMVLDSIITKHRLLYEYESLNSDRRELYTFDEYKPVLEKRLTNELSDEIQKKYQKVVTSIKNKHQFELFNSNIDTLSKLYMRTLISHRDDSLSKTGLDYLQMTNFENPLYQLDAKNIGLSSLTETIRDFPYALPDQYSDPNLLRNIIETVVVNNLVIRQSKKSGFNKSDGFKLRLEIQTNQLLYQTVFIREITKNIEINDDTLYRFYLDNRDSLYLTRRRYEVQEIFMNDQNTAEMVLQRALRNEDFQALADTYTERYQNKPRKGYLGYIYENTYASIGKCAAKTDAGKIYPEIIPSGKGYSIIKVLSIDEPSPISFDEIKGRVLNDCKKSKIKRRKKELLEELKHKYSYNIDRSILFN